jgi:ubiquinone/menaquinone biosynthesis C-methylase UbiE
MLIDLATATHIALTTLIVIAIVWAVISALATIFLWLFLRERYGRVGPMPVSQALMQLSPQRRRMHRADETVRSFHLCEGDTVLELGPGPGYFSIEAARVVGATGHVLCVDLQPGMTRILQGRLAEAHVTNAAPLVGEAASLPLAGASVDAAYLVHVLGEIPDRPTALAELRRVIRPGGTLSILETLTDPDYQLEATVRDLCAATGFAPKDHHRRRLGYTLTFTVPANS